MAAPAAAEEDSDLDDVITTPSLDLRTADRVGELCAFRRLRLDLYSCSRNSRTIQRRRRTVSDCPVAASLQLPETDGGRSRCSSLWSVSTSGDSVEAEGESFYASGRAIRGLTFSPE